MPKYNVRYTGPMDWVIEADHEFTAEMQAHDSISDSFIAEEIEEED